MQYFKIITVLFAVIGKFAISNAIVWNFAISIAILWKFAIPKYCNTLQYYCNTILLESPLLLKAVHFSSRTSTSKYWSQLFVIDFHLEVTCYNTHFMILLYIFIRQVKCYDILKKCCIMKSRYNKDMIYQELLELVHYSLHNHRSKLDDNLHQIVLCCIMCT